MEGEWEGSERGQLQAMPRVIARRGHVCRSPDAVLTLPAGAARLAGLVPPRAVPLPAPRLYQRGAAWLAPDYAKAADARDRPLAYKCRVAGVAQALMPVQG